MEYVERKVIVKDERENEVARTTYQNRIILICKNEKTEKEKYYWVIPQEDKKSDVYFSYLEEAEYNAKEWIDNYAGEEYD